MSLNIKNARAHKLAGELASLTGESITAAVTQAVVERLDRLKQKGEFSRFERLRAIAKDCAAHIDPAQRALDHGALLYDDLGMPR